jgi:hypothetical protein
MKVNLTKRVSTPLGFRYYPVVTSANGRVKPDWVLVNGAEEKITGGSYYLEWRENNRRVRLSVGKIATTAVSRKMRKESELLAVSRGVSVVPEADQGADAGKHSVQAAVADFLEETRLSKKPKTYAAYQGTLAYFLESCHKLYMEDIERSDMLKFAGFLKDKGLAPRTCWNKFNNTMSFLKANGIRGIVNKNDWPKFVEEEPEIYEKEDVAALMAVSDEQEKLWWEFFLMTGMREQEVMYTTWRDVDFAHHAISVRWKPEYNWTPRAYKERTVPVPEKLIVKLRTLKAASRPGARWYSPRRDASRSWTSWTA